jgi:hypothetical protein
MRTILALAFAPLLIPAAHAQSTGPNGGMLAGKGGHETELVLSPTELTIYIIEDGKAHSTKGVTLRAIVQQGGKNTAVPLADVENKKLVGKLASPIGAGAIVVVTGKDDHGHAVSARYTIK